MEHIREQGPGLVGLNYQVLRGVLVGDREGFLKGGYINQRAALEALQGDVPAWQHLQLVVNLLLDLCHQRLGGGEQQNLRVDAVLSLREQICGHKGRGGGLIGDDEHLRGACGHVAGRAVRIETHLELGLGDPGVAGAKHLVHFWDGVGSKGHGRDGLRAADFVDVFHPRGAGGHQDGGGHLPVATRRGAEHDAGALSQGRGDREHEHRGGQGSGPSGGIEPHGLQRSGDSGAAHPGACADGVIVHPLALVKASNLPGGGLDGFDLGSGQRVVGCLELCIRHPELLKAHVVDLGGELDDARVSLCADPLDDPRDGFTHVGTGLAGGPGQQTRLILLREGLPADAGDGVAQLGHGAL